MQCLPQAQEGGDALCRQEDEEGLLFPERQFGHGGGDSWVTPPPPPSAGGGPSPNPGGIGGSTEGQGEERTQGGVGPVQGWEGNPQIQAVG